MRRTPDRRGAAATELAVVLPLLVLICAMAVDYARVFMTTQVLNSAASSGALYASGSVPSPSTSGSLVNAAKAAACIEGRDLALPLTANQVTVSIATQTVTVTVEYDQPMLTGFLVHGRTVRLRRTVTMPVAPRVGD